MNLQGTSNPVLNDKAFRKAATSYSLSEVMTVKGTMNKVLLLFGMLVLTAAFVWANYSAALAQSGDQAVAMQSIMSYVLVGAIGGFIAALVAVFKRSWISYVAPIYAALEGLFVGGVSAIMESFFPGIVVQAIMLTLAVFGVMLFLYQSKILKATAGFKKGVIAATFGIAAIYLLTFVLGMFGIEFGYVHDSGPIGIGFSLVVVGIAALNLVLDFDFIERQSEAGAPKQMEWYGAFGLMVTLVWLYIEILRLLSKLRD